MKFAILSWCKDFSFSGTEVAEIGVDMARADMVIEGYMTFV